MYKGCTKLIRGLYKQSLYNAYTRKAYTKLIRGLYKSHTKLRHGLCKAYARLIQSLYRFGLAQKAFPPENSPPSGLLRFQEGPSIFQSGESFRDGRRVFIIKTSIRGPPLIFMMGSSISKSGKNSPAGRRGFIIVTAFTGRRSGLNAEACSEEREVEKAQKRCWGAERGVFRVSRDMFSFISRCIFHCIFHVIREVRLL